MLNPADDAFGHRLPQGVLRPVAPHYLDEPRDRYHGRAGLVAAPRNTDEVAAILRSCHAARVGVVTMGGGTGLVGGQIFAGEGPAPLVLSLERMNRIRAIYPEEDALVTEAGATLQSVREAANSAGRVFPLSIGSQGTAQIGGILGTNAGGANTLRWGTARALCFGIEAVLPDGQILNGLTRLHKDNTGYSIRDLLIGAEGTLGVITAASLRLAPAPRERGVAFLRVPSPAAALSLLALAQAHMAGCVQAFELIAGTGLEFLAEVAPDLRQPLDEVPQWSVLIEIALPEGLETADALESLLVAAMEAELVEDGVIAQSGQQAASFWEVREQIPEANRRIGALASHDIALPLSEIPRFIRECGDWIAATTDLRLNCFGHLGDGNLHYNLFPPAGRTRADYTPEFVEAITAGVHDRVMALGGTFSAEHGIGRLKAAELTQRGDPAKLAAMRAIKAALDPHGIMNPGAVLA